LKKIKRIFFRMSFIILCSNTIIGQTKVRLGDLKYMYKDSSKAFPLSCNEYLLKKTLPDGIYVIIKSKHDTCAIIKLKNKQYSGEQIWFQENTEKNDLFSKTYRYLINVYNNDVLQKESFYHINGHKISETIYQNGKKNGKEIFFNENGKIVTENVFFNDSLRNWITYYNNGNVKSEGYGGFTYRENFLKEYYENGTLKRTIYFLQGIPQNYFLFYDNGVIKEIGHLDIYEEDVKLAYSYGFKDFKKIMNYNKFEKVIFDVTGKRK